MGKSATSPSLKTMMKLTSSGLFPLSVSVVSRWSFHAWHPNDKGVPRWCSDLRTKPSSHVQLHLPSGEEAPGGSNQRWLQIHISGCGPGHGCWRQLPSALPRDRYGGIIHMLLTPGEVVFECSRSWRRGAKAKRWLIHINIQSREWDRSAHRPEVVLGFHNKSIQMGSRVPNQFILIKVISSDHLADELMNTLWSCSIFFTFTLTKQMLTFTII